MRIVGGRYRLWHFMLAVAGLAVLFAALGVTTTAAVLIVAGMIGLPVLVVGRGRRSAALAWICLIYPMLCLGSLYTTWFTAWLVLGHRPRVSLDDPKFISPIVDVPFMATFLLLMGIPLAMVCGLVLLVGQTVSNLANPNGRPWLSLAGWVVAILAWIGPFLVGDYLNSYTILAWYFD
ncbi:MAG: hypothetical protein ACYC61_19965 [Isosphaeraceae bacterium]